MYPANPCCDFAVHCCVLLCRPATGDPNDTGRWQNPALCWCTISTACFMQEAAARGSNPLSASVTFVPGRYHPWHRARGKATDVLPSSILLRQSRISPAPCTPRWRFPWATSSHSTRSFCWWRATYSRGMSVTSSLWVWQGFPFSVAKKRWETMKVRGSGHNSSLAGPTAASVSSRRRASPCLELMSSQPTCSL